MAYENLCMYCFEELGGEAVCPHCGRDSRAAVPQIQLLPGTTLYNGRFLVGRAMGQDASGIVYMAYDTKRESTLRIREYLPRESARRLNDGAIVPVAGAEDDFEKGLEKLKASVESVEDPKKRHFFFEENGTAYIAQRKSASGASVGEEDEKPERSPRQLALIIGIAAVVVLAIVFVLIRLLTNAFDSQDLTPNSTLESDGLWLPDETPTPTPYAAGTYGAITDPELSWKDYVYGGDVNSEYETQSSNDRTASPTATPTPRPTSQVINENSSTAEITALQRQLIELGWLNASSPTGKYDSATKQAVRDFQTYMNATYAIDPKLTVDGLAGPQTLYWLDMYEVSRKPTPTPTLPVQITSTPGATVNENSSSSAIKTVQRYLIALDYLDAGADDGVYGSTTRAAVRDFQEFINSMFGDVLPVTGEVDSLTLDYLAHYSAWWEENKPTPTPAPSDTTAAAATPTDAIAAPPTPTPSPTPTPTPSPTPTPTPSPTPYEPEGDDAPSVDKDSPTEAIMNMQAMLVQLGLLDNADGVFGSATEQALMAFQQLVNEAEGRTVLEVNGQCTAETLQYLEDYVYNYDGGTGNEEDGTPTDSPTEADPTPGSVSAPSITFSNPVSFEDNIYYVDSNFTITWSSTGDVGSYRVTIQDTSGNTPVSDQEGTPSNNTMNVNVSQLTLGEIYDISVSAIPANGTVADAVTSYAYFALKPEGTPSIGNVSAPSINISDVSREEGGISYITGNTEIHWSADGDIEGYDVRITDTAGKEHIGEVVGSTTTYIPVDTDRLEAGMTYTIRVGVIPANGSTEDAVYASRDFVYEVAEEQPTESPVGSVSAPAINVTNTSRIEGALHYISGNTDITWSADGDVQGYLMRITDSTGKELVNTSSITSDTSTAVDPSNMELGLVYTILVGVVPINGTQDDVVTSSLDFALDATTEQPSEPDATMPPTIDKNSDDNWILEMQNKLYDLGYLLMDENPTRGVYDEATRNAVLRFQQSYNESNPESPLVEIDPTDPDAVVDATTLSILMNY